MKSTASHSAEHDFRFGRFSPITPFHSIKKPDTAEFSIGLEDMGIFSHHFFSTPILLNSSELIFETSRSAPARATNKSSKIETTTTNIVHSFLYDYYNHFEIEKIYPLTVLIFICISVLQGILVRRAEIIFVPLSHTPVDSNRCTNHLHRIPFVVLNILCTSIMKLNCGKPVL
jgi:hypothetical protein